MSPGTSRARWQLPFFFICLILGAYVLQFSPGMLLAPKGCSFLSHPLLPYGAAAPRDPPGPSKGPSANAALYNFTIPLPRIFWTMKMDAFSLLAPILEINSHEELRDSKASCCLVFITRPEMHYIAVKSGRYTGTKKRVCFSFFKAGLPFTASIFIGRAVEILRAPCHRNPVTSRVHKVA